MLVFYLSIHNPGLARFLQARIETFPLIPDFVRSRLLKVMDSLRVVRGMRPADHMRIFLFGLVKLSLGWLNISLYARALGMEIGWQTTGWIRPAIQLLTVVPLSVSGLGVREGGALFLLRPLGIPPHEIVAWTFLWFAGMVFVGAIGGILELRNFLGPKRN